MKSNFVLLLMLCFLSVKAWAQTNEAISYQAIARDIDGKVLSEQTIGIQVEILQGSAEGSVVLKEADQITSTSTGVVNLLIGKQSSLSTIDWSAGPYFLRLSMDTNGGNDYKVVSTTQMLPVPFALYAAKAGEVENNNTTTSGTVPFIIVPNESSDDLYEIFAGDLKEYYSERKSMTIDLESTIYYLNGVDQHLDLCIEGLPENAEKTQRDSKSSSLCRYSYIEYINIPIQNYDNLKLIIYNELTNKIIKEYPFKITTVKNESL